MPHRWLLGVLLAVLLCLGAAPAGAETSVAVLGVEAVDASDNVAQQLSRELERRVKTTPRLKYVPGKALEEIKLVFGCMDERPECMAKVGVSLKVDKLLWGTLQGGDGQFTFTVKLVDVSSARVEKFASEKVSAQELQGSGTRDVVGKMTRAFWVGKLGSILVTANVPEAQILLDERAVGSTGVGGFVIQDVVPGPHQLEVWKDGYTRWEQSVTVPEGKAAEANAVLDPAPVTPTPHPATEGSGLQDEPGQDDGRGGWKIAFWTSAALTVGLGVGGVVTGLQKWGAEDDLDQYVDENWASGYGSGVDDICSPTAEEGFDDPEVTSLCDKAENRAMLSTVFFIGTGAAALATAVFGYLAYLHGDRPSQDSDRKDDPSTQARSGHRREEPSVQWSLTPTLGPQGGAMGFQLRF